MPRASTLTSLTAALVVVCTPAAGFAADPCREIVTATLAEMRAGAEDWNEQTEALARSAAGSACVKAVSGGYLTTPAAQALPAAEGARTDQDDTTVTVAEAEAEATTAGLDPDAEVTEGETEEAPEDGKAGWKFLGFEVNDVDSNPGKKPYERRR
jgi:hypothetical protein